MFSHVPSLMVRLSSALAPDAFGLFVLTHLHHNRIPVPCAMDSHLHWKDGSSKCPSLDTASFYNWRAFAAEALPGIEMAARERRACPRVRGPVRNHARTDRNDQVSLPPASTLSTSHTSFGSASLVRREGEAEWPLLPPT